MPKFKVTIKRKYIYSTTIEVKAKNETEAEQIAKDIINNCELTEDGYYIEVKD